MKKSQNILEQLRQNRRENLHKLAFWEPEDFSEMMKTYLEAKSIAIESSDFESLAILDEKISQLEEALQASAFDGQGEVQA